MLNSISLKSLRIYVFFFGFAFGVWWQLVYGDWSMATWARGDLLGFILVPPTMLVIAIIYLVTLAILVFKSIKNRQDLINFATLLFLSMLLTIVGMITSAGSWDSVPFFRITNAPISVFDVATVEQESGFTPLLPTTDFPEVVPKYRIVHPGEFTMTFERGLSNIDVSQVLSDNGHHGYDVCTQRIQSDWLHTVPISIVGHRTQLYYPAEDVLEKYSYTYCVPLTDRLVLISADDRRLDLDTLKNWLENLEYRWVL